MWHAIELIASAGKSADAIFSIIKEHFGSQPKILMFPSPGEPCYVWLRRAVKAQDELAALGLDGRLTSHKSPDIWPRKTSDMDLLNHKMT